MDIYLFGQDSLKIKSKKATLAVDPKTAIQKFDADAILLTGEDTDVNRITNYRLVISGPGEYEVSGLKIGGLGADGSLMYSLISDNVNALVVRASALKKVSAEKIGDYQIVVINADEDINESLVTAMEPNIVVVYGQKAVEAVKALGKGSAVASSKVSFAEDKLPEETEVLLLR